MEIIDERHQFNMTLYEYIKIRLKNLRYDIYKPYHWQRNIVFVDKEYMETNSKKPFKSFRKRRYRLPLMAKMEFNKQIYTISTSEMFFKWVLKDIIKDFESKRERKDQREITVILTNDLEDKFVTVVPEDLLINDAFSKCLKY